MKLDRKLQKMEKAWNKDRDEAEKDKSSNEQATPLSRSKRPVFNMRPI